MGLNPQEPHWRHHLARNGGYEVQADKADPDVWLRQKKADGTKYYEYVFVYG
jgi:hypothetical protein